MTSNQEDDFADYDDGWIGFPENEVDEPVGLSFEALQNFRNFRGEFEYLNQRPPNWREVELKELPMNTVFDSQKLRSQAATLPPVEPPVDPSVDQFVAPHRGPYIQTFSGRRFHYQDYGREDFDLMDIAHSLSNECRFAGHVSSFYSVAQHSLLVSTLLPKELGLYGLLHDGAEAYFKDVPSPLKKLVGTEYRILAARCQDELYRWAGLAPPSGTVAEMLHAADRKALATEARDLMASFDLGVPTITIADAAPERINPLPPHAAKYAFVQAFFELGGAKAITTGGAT